MEVRDGYAQSAVGLIPGDWACKPLADFLSFISYGFTNPMPTVADGVYMITAADIDHGKLQLASARKTSISSFQKLLTAKSKPRVNDVLLTKDGSLGRLALVGEETICINQSVAVLRANEKVEPNFLKLLLESPWYQTRMLEDAGGSTIKHIYITIVDKMPIGLPLDKAEQRAIATALSDVDALIAGLEKLIAKKRNLKQAAMQQLLTGQTRLPGFSGDWDYFHVAELEKLGLLKLGRGNVISKKDIDATPGDCPIYSSSVKNDGEFGRYGHFMFDEELITWSVDGGGNFFYRAKHRFSVTNVCGYMRADSKRLNYRYLAAQLQFEHGKKSFDYQSKAHPSVVRAEYLVPIPKHEEQTAIATAISDMDADLSALETRLTKSRAIKQGMMQELLTGRTRLI
jgi:type I restriction enzyme S subunit